MHVGANNAEKDGTSTIVGMYRRLVKPLRGNNWTACVVGDITSNGRQGPGDDITVCLYIAEKAGQVMGGGRGGAVLVHVVSNNAEKEGTSAIVGKYRRMIKTLKEARVGQILLLGILPIIGGRCEEYRNCRRMAINTQVQKVCMEEGVGFVDMWLNSVGKDAFCMRDGLHLTG